MKTQALQKIRSPSQSEVEGKKVTSLPRVLIIEDNDYDAKRVESALLGRQPGPSQCFEVEIVTNIGDVLPYLDRDEIDLYFIDLNLGSNLPTIDDKLLGEYLIEKISESSNAGIIVYSSMPVETQAARSMLAGADEYIGKTTTADSPDIIRSKAIALWRRILPYRSSSSKPRAHSNRTFMFGGWRFVVGSRQVQNERGQTARLSQLEHALLRHLAVVDENEIDRETFAAYVLGRSFKPKDRRLDSIVTRLRTKLGDSLQIVAREGRYKLLDVSEIKPK